VTFLERAASILVGSTSAARLPEVVRGVAVRALPGDRALVYLPVAHAERTLANIAATAQLAVTAAGVPTYNTIQLKGTVTNVRDATDDERALAETYRAGFAAEYAWAGDIARRRVVTVWPCKVLELHIDMIFIEAPAPLEFPA
jgi:hypothetical protein